MTFFESSSRSNLLFEHNLIPKTGSHFSGSCSKPLEPVEKMKIIWASFPGTERSEGAGEPSNQFHSHYLQLSLLDSGFAASQVGVADLGI